MAKKSTGSPLLDKIISRLDALEKKVKELEGKKGK